MTVQFCQGQNMRALLRQEELPKELHALLPAYERKLNADTRGTLLNDLMADIADTFDLKPKEPSRGRTPEVVGQLSTAIHKLLETRLAAGKISSKRLYKKTVFEWAGQRFQTRDSSSFSDSKVVFSAPHSPPEDFPQGDWRIGCIQSIFQYSEDNSEGSNLQTFIVVDEYRPLNAGHIPFDHFRKFPLLGGRIYYEKFRSTPVLLAIEDVLGHFGYTQMEVPGIVDSEGLPINCVHAKPFIKDRKLPPSSPRAK